MYGNTQIIWWFHGSITLYHRTLCGVPYALILHFNFGQISKRFTKGNHFCFLDFLRDLHSIKQGDRSLSQYFTDTKIIWDELEDLQPTPTCSCINHCTYDPLKLCVNTNRWSMLPVFSKVWMINIITFTPRYCCSMQG